jgi:hypothetical protein
MSDMAFDNELRDAEEGIRLVKELIRYMHESLKGGEQNRTALGRLMYYSSKNIPKSFQNDYISARHELETHFNSIVHEFREDQLVRLLNHLRQIYEYSEKQEHTVRFLYGVVRISKEFDERFRHSNINPLVYVLVELYNKLSHGKISHFISMCARSDNPKIITLAQDANGELYRMHELLEHIVICLRPLSTK